jgi:oligoendopeptidase F
MMFANLPKSPDELLAWDWPQFDRLARDLLQRPLNADSVDGWLQDWSDLGSALVELYNRLYLATSINTADAAAEQAYAHYIDHIFPHSMEADQALKQKLLDSQLEPAGFDMALRNLRAEAALFRAESLPLLAQEQKLSNEYDKITSAQTVTWDGRECTVIQLRPAFQDLDRGRREQAWRLKAGRQMADRGALNDLWVRFLKVRQQLAANAGQPDYRAYRWQQLLRFDYTPADCRGFNQAVEEVVVPAAQRAYERRRRRLGVAALRPWDLDVDMFGRPPLRPYQAVDELKARTSAIFRQVDPQLGAYFDQMVREGLLDLDNRKHKAPGGYCTDFPMARKPFIFMNGVGLHDDVQTLLHEGGHAFHVYESRDIRLIMQLQVPMEFAEVASMGMELLASPYLEERLGGFYTRQDAARARAEHLESSLLFLPYMAVVDAFQHWAYEHPAAAAQPARCDAAWTELWGRFMPGVDWSGLEDILATGWQRKLHIFLVPFYYIEYGLAQLGAVQVWRNALRDQAGAVARYRQALALGGSVPLPQLYQTAGARLAFDAETMAEVVSLMEAKIDELEAVE